MDVFFDKYGFKAIRDTLIANGITDVEFYLMDNVRILELLHDFSDEMIDFVSKYSFEKGKALANSGVDKHVLLEEVEEMDVEQTESSEESSNVVENSVNKEKVERSNEVESLPTAVSTEFVYKETDLFNFLNAPNNLSGRIILGKYKLTKSLDYSRLKEMLIMIKIQEDNIYYKIKPEVFIDLRDQIVELFPTEDKDFLYVPYYKNDHNEAISARGCLYNCYKYIRKQLRAAGILTDCIDEDDEAEADTSRTNDQDSTLECLTDADRSGHSVATVVPAWEESFSERQKLLLNKRSKDNVSLEIYFKSFPCLAPPLGISLLHLDLNAIFEDLAKKNALNKDVQASYSSLLSKSWDPIAKKILLFSKKSRIKEVKDFLAENDHLIKAGDYDELLAFLLLPLCVTVPKSFKVTETQTVSVSKQDISKSFILSIKDPQNLDAQKSLHEKWLRDFNQPIHPYVVIIGELDNVTHTYIVLNSETYSYSDLTKAIESCFKCLTALRSFPYVCDYAWGIIKKLVFDLDPDKKYSPVSKFTTEIKKL